MTSPHHSTPVTTALSAAMGILLAAPIRAEVAAADDNGMAGDGNQPVEAGNDAAPTDADQGDAATPVTPPTEEGADSASANGRADDEEEVIEEVAPEVVAEKGFFPSAFDGDAAARRDRGVNVLTARTVRKQSLVLIIEHRPYQSLFTGEDVFFDYLGFDSGNLKVALGLRYGIIEGLDVGFTRLSDGHTVAFDTYELNARYAFLRQEKHHIDASLLAGISWFAQKDRKDAAGGFAQIFVDRVFFDLLLVGAGFGFHSDSSSDEKAMDDEAFSGAVLGVVEWRMIDALAFTAEIAANVFGYEEKYPVFSFAIKILTHRHVFSLMLTNTQFILSDGIVADTWRGPKDWVFGFQIVREFNFGQSE